MPEIIDTTHDIQRLTSHLRREGKRIGVVPTMGALHAGHLSLVHAAKRDCQVAIATIFVNPTQFAPHEDFSKYPRTLEADLAMLGEAGCDYVFTPSNDVIYPPDFTTYIQPPRVSLPLEGTFRPDHFRGVCTVVLKLLNLVASDAAYFGRKDYQQALVIRTMVSDLNVPVAIEVCPIVREPDGLAMSSRNRYLSPAERQQSLALSQALASVKEAFTTGERDVATLRECLIARLESDGIARIDYATVVDAETLADIETIDRPAVALIACHVGTTRLIDNEILA